MRQISKTTVCSLPLVLLIAFTPAGGQAISIGPNVQVSKDRLNLVHDELTMAADPNNPNHLLACALVMRLDRYKPYDIAYVSRDAGRTLSLGVGLQETSSGDRGLRL